jgi:hypothetical protein
VYEKLENKDVFHEMVKLSIEKWKNSSFMMKLVLA